MANSRKWIKSQPRYLNQERLDRPIYSLCPTFFCCGSDHEDEDGMTTTGPFWCRHDTCINDTFESMMPCIEGKNDSPDALLEKRRFYHLFPYGKHEVNHQLFMLRFLFLGNAVYLSVFIMCMVPMYIDSAFKISSCVVLTVAGLTPGLLIYFRYMYRIIGVSTQVTGVEHFRMRRMIEKVKRTQKEQRCVTMLRMLVALNRRLQTGSDKQKEQFGQSKSNDRHRSIVQLMTKHQKDKESKTKIADHLNNHTNIKLDHFADIFDTLDKNGDGDLTKAEITKMMSKFGVTLDEETFSLMAQADMDPVGNFQPTKDDETIQKEEFLIFLMNMTEEGETVNAHDIVEFVFHLWDKGEDVVVEEGEEGESKQPNRDMKISVSELQAGLASLGESFTASDISNIINELDINDDGEFDHHEFLRWVEYHDTTGTSSEEDVDHH